MRKQEQRLKDALRSLDNKPTKAIQKRKHLTAFERRMKNAKKIFG
jgi:hypothetical protein